MEGKYQTIKDLHSEGRDKIHNVLASSKDDADIRDLNRVLIILDEIANVSLKPTNHDTEEATKN